MYEENREPLPQQEATVVFSEQLKTLRSAGLANPAPPVTPETVLRWAETARRPSVTSICRRLLLPGSDVCGIEHLRELVALAESGKSCLLCLNHRSTLDVPTLCALLEDQSDSALFDRLIWISGRKLEEDVGMTSVLVQCVHRIVISPSTWFAGDHDDEELHQGKLVNMAAERTIANLRDKGWVFAMFPAGTRTRLDDPSTREAIIQMQGYLHLFEYVVLGNISGCTMPVSRDRDLSRETPKLDEVVFSFGPVSRTEHWLQDAVERYPDLDARTATAQAIIADIERLAPEQPSE